MLRLPLMPVPRISFESMKGTPFGVAPNLSAFSPWSAQSGHLGPLQPQLTCARYINKMSDPTSRLLPRTARRRRWEWRAVAVVVIIALCGFAATSGIRFRAQVPHNRHYRPAERNESSLPVVLWHGLGDSCCASHSIGYVANLISDSLGESV